MTWYPFLWGIFFLLMRSEPNCGGRRRALARAGMRASQESLGKKCSPSLTHSVNNYSPISSDARPSAAQSQRTVELRRPTDRTRPKSNMTVPVITSENSRRSAALAPPETHHSGYTTRRHKTNMKGDIISHEVSIL